LHYGYGIGNIFLEDVLDNAIDRGTNNAQFSDIRDNDNYGNNNDNNNNYINNFFTILYITKSKIHGSRSWIW
jgi:hypothetical protein